ncbi:MAG TPA: gluconeogenesis factor YvcK family protein [Candidatus Paceibacterota bacterium]
MKNKNIVVIGGGTGTFMVLSALKNYPVNLTAIVSMADDGGSTGILRDQYGVLPPGDVRRALVALSEDNGKLRELFNFRFQNGDFNGHNFGNIFLSSLEKITGNFAGAVEEASKILNVKGNVIPVTLNNVRLHAKLRDGTVIKGETNIDIPSGRSVSPIEKVWLEPKAKISLKAKKAIATADAIVIGPGDLFTSLIPNLLVSGVSEAIRKSKARKIFVCNLMTKFGETHNFSAQDFVDSLEAYLGKNVLDFVVFNKIKPNPSVLKKYKKENSEFVDPKNLNLRNKKPKYITADLIDGGPFIRHNLRQKLAKILLSLL